MQDVFDGRRIEWEALFQQFAVDPVVTHVYVLKRDIDHQHLDGKLHS